MVKSAEDTNSCTCSPPRQRSGVLTLAGGIVIALLPKCPFCLLAYSSAVTMCSGATVYDHKPGWFSAVSIALAVIVIATILRNYRGPRSGLALVLAVGGAGVVAYSELISGQLASYQAGAYLLLAGALLNGGLVPVFRSWGRRMTRHLAKG